MRRGIYIYTPDIVTPRWRFRSVLFVVIPLILTAASWWFLVGSNQQLSQARLHAKTHEIVNVLEGDIEVYADLLYSVRALFLVNPNLTRDQWDAFMLTQHFSERYPASWNIAISQKVKYEDVENVRALLESRRRSGEPAIQMKMVDAQMAVVTLVTNPSSVAKFLGLNLYYREAYNETLLRAQETAVPSASKVYESEEYSREGDSEFMIALSLFESLSGAEASSSEFAQATSGYVTITTDTSDLLDSTFDALSISDDVYVTATDAAGTIFYERGDERDLLAFTDHAYIDVGGQMWKISFSAPLDYGLTVREQVAPHLFLVGGLILSALLMGVHFYHSGVRIRFIALRPRRQSRE